MDSNEPDSEICEPLTDPPFAPETTSKQRIAITERMGTALRNASLKALRVAHVKDPLWMQ
jgi:hypothetical protein